MFLTTGTTAKMFVDLINILSVYGDTIVQDIRSNMQSTGTNATGKTSKSLRYEVKQQGTKTILKVYGKPFLAVVETGRKPTPQFTKPSKAFVASIKEWVKARGINEGAAYSIAKSIHQKGTRLHNSGGRKDILSNVINPSLTDKIARDGLSRFAKTLMANIKQAYGSNSN